jgi:hypothetical protein
MLRFRLLACVSIVMLAGAGAAGVALGAEASLDTLLSVDLPASVQPALLGPITASGRAGWDCAPEHHATASKTADADLPEVPR